MKECKVPTFMPLADCTLKHMVEYVMKSGFYTLCIWMLLLVGSQTAVANQIDLNTRLKTIENEIGGRIGVSLLNGDQTWSYKGDQRFPMTSTFKAMACAALLYRAEVGIDNPNRKVVVQKEDIVPWSPVTKENIGNELTLAELCTAVMEYSDNAASNLILKSLGGPAGLTQFMREIGDEYSRLDRWEPELNQASPGDIRDTTTPNAITQNLKKIYFDRLLTPHSYALFDAWMQGNRVADPLLRSVLPDGWSIGDRAGAGGFGSRGIISVIFPPEREPFFLSIYITETNLSLSERNKVIAMIGDVVLQEVEL